MEIRHEPSWYDKEQLPYMTSTQIVLFNKVHIQQVSVPTVQVEQKQHMVSKKNEEGNIDVKTGKYDKNN